MMRFQFLTFFAFISTAFVCHALLDEKILKDVYSIYTSAAIDTRDLKGDPVTPNNVTFYFFTRQNPENYISFKATDDISKISDTNAKYVFIVHGWLENREKEWYEDLKNAFLRRNDDYYNVIQVDWTGPANEVYGIASGSTKDVGFIIGDLITRFYRENHIPIEHFHIVGHSLGGQVAGFAGKRVYYNTGKKIARITGLDAAGPLFVTREPTEKLGPYDAEVVVAIHTDGGTFGYNDAIGTIDFFPNGGSDQPGCRKIDLLDITSVAEPVYCDHQRSWGYFIEAVNHPEAFPAKRCQIQKKLLVFNGRKCFDDDVIHMGDLKVARTGQYYLTTNTEKPYRKASDLAKLSDFFSNVVG